MPRERRGVLIPIIRTGSDAGDLLHIEADATPREEHKAGLNPVIAHLRQYQLYGAGEAALTAIRRLPMVRRTGGNLPFFRDRPVSGYLEASNGEACKGLTRETSASAELGLALALLMHAGQSTARTIFATGALARSGDASAATRTDVPVFPVDGLSAKFAVIARSLATKGAALPDVLIIPHRTMDDRPTLEVHADDIVRLKAEFLARGTELQVHAVATLEEAAERLGITSLGLERRQRAALALGSGFVAACMISLLTWAWMAQPFAIELSKRTVAGLGEIATPIRIRFDSQGNRLKAPDCQANGISLYGRDDWIVLGAEVKTPERLAMLFGGYRFAVFSVTQNGGVKEWPERDMQATGDLGRPRFMTAGPASDGRDELTRIVVLTRRIFQFDTAAIGAELRRLVEAAPAAEKLNAGSAFLARQAPGYLKLDIRTTGGVVQCNSSL